MVHLYILCGLPFSGKSTLGKEISEKIDCELISFDSVQQSSAEEDKDISYDKVVINCRKQIANALAEGSVVVYDNINAKEEHREDLKTIAEFMRLKTQVVYLKVPVAEIQKRRAKSLSDEDFNIVLEQFEEPQDAAVIENEEDKKLFLSTLPSRKI